MSEVDVPPEESEDADHEEEGLTEIGIILVAALVAVAAVIIILLLTDNL